MLAGCSVARAGEGHPSVAVAAEGDSLAPAVAGGDSLVPAAAGGDSLAPAVAGGDSLVPAVAGGDSLVPAAAAPDSAPPAQPSRTQNGRELVEGLPIHTVDIQARNVFEPVPPGRLEWLYRLGNRLHIRTRKRTIRSQLLFRSGEPWKLARAEETERNLRALNYLTPERIEAVAAGDSAKVTVVTRDIWSTSPEFNLESAGQKRYGSVSYTDRNLLGLGKAFSLSYKEDASGTSRSFQFVDPNVFNSRFQLRYSAGHGSGGVVDQVAVGIPFYAEDTPHSYGVTVSRSTSVARLYQRGSEVATLDRGVDETEVYWGQGRRLDGVIQRVVLSVLVRDRRLSAPRLGPTASPEFTTGAQDLRLRLPAVELILWRPDFIERINVNRMVLIEDFDVGTSGSLKLGMAPRLLGSTADEGYARAGVQFGARTGHGFGWVQSSASARLRHEPRHVVSQIDARWYRQWRERRTLALAVRGVSGWRADPDFQVVVGGLNGLRGYPVQALAGDRLVRVNLEDRWLLLPDYREMVAVGVVGFSDVARSWGPGSEGAGWFYSAGVGLRLGLPRWSPNQILRIDVAWPISPTRDGGREAVLSFGSSQAF